MTPNEAAEALEGFRDETYPADIFRPIPEDILPALDQWLSDTYGHRLDALSALYCRRVLSLAISVLRQTGKEGK